MQAIEGSGLGFQLLRDTIASYKRLPPGALPDNATDGVKVQAWVVQQSREAGLNFGPFYRAWGWPVTAETLGALQDLPPLNFTAGYA